MDNSNLCLVPVDPRLSLHLAVLRDLLAERPAYANISHKAMPTWDEHKAFVSSNPYQVWYIVEVDNHCVGTVYLTRKNEIGVAIFAEHQRRGYATEAIKTLVAHMGNRRYLANIAPGNAASQDLFEKLGFECIQLTYERPL